MSTRLLMYPPCIDPITGIVRESTPEEWNSWQLYAGLTKTFVSDSTFDDRSYTSDKIKITFEQPEVINEVETSLNKEISDLKMQITYLSMQNTQFRASIEKLEKHFGLSVLEESGPPKLAVCECGGDKARTTHSTWCNKYV